MFFVNITHLLVDDAIHTNYSKAFDRVHHILTVSFSIKSCSFAMILFFNDFFYSLIVVSRYKWVKLNSSNIINPSPGVPASTRSSFTPSIFPLCKSKLIRFDHMLIFLNMSMIRNYSSSGLLILP